MSATPIEWVISTRPSAADPRVSLSVAVTLSHIVRHRLATNPNQVRTLCGYIVDTRPDILPSRQCGRCLRIQRFHELAEQETSTR